MIKHQTLKNDKIEDKTPLNSVKKVQKRTLIRMIWRFIPHFFVLLCLLTGSIFSFVAFTQNNKNKQLKKLEANQQQTQKEITQTQDLIERQRQNKKSSIAELDLLQRQIGNQTNAIENINEQLAELDQYIAERQAQITAIEQQIDLLRTQYVANVRRTWLSQHQHNDLLFLFSASDFNAWFRHALQLQRFSKWRRQQFDTLFAKHDTLTAVLNDYHTQAAQQRLILNSRQQQIEQLNQTEEDQKAILARLNKQEKNLVKQLAAQQKKYEGILAKIQDFIIREAERQRLAPNNVAANTTNSKISSELLKNKGAMPMPVANGTVIMGYGLQQSYLNSAVKQNNKTITIAATGPASVTAIFDGTIKIPPPVRGVQSVIVYHGNYLSVYSNLSELLVVDGQTVNKNQPIGKISPDAGSDQAILRFGMAKLVGGSKPEFFNPAGWVGW